MNSLQLRKSDYIFLFVLFVLFYLLNRFSIFTCDDLYYSFIAGMSGGINSEYILVESFSDAVKSNIYDYMHWNGRFIVHTLTSYFCGVLGLSLFRVLNSIIFTLLIGGVIKLVRNEFGYNKTDKFLILLLLFVFMQVGAIFLGHIAYVINYLWTSCGIIYFLLLYNNIRDGNKYNIGLINILLFIFGIIIGSLQESFTIGLSCALFFYYCFNFKELKGSTVWLVIGFWLGTCIVTFAPGNFVRLEGEAGKVGFNMFMRYVNNFGHLICDSRLLLICILLTIIVYLRNKTFMVDFLKKNVIYYLVIMFNSIVVILVYTGKWQLTCIELFSMILIIKLIYSFLFELTQKYGLILNSVIVFILLMLYIPIYKDRVINYSRYESIHSKCPIDGVIVDKDFIEKGRYIGDRSFLSNYCYYDFNDLQLFTLKGLSLVKSGGKDINFVTAILPDTPYNIEALFKDNNAKYIYDKRYRAIYFRYPKDKIVENITFVVEPTGFSSQIRNKIFNIECQKNNPVYNLNTYKYSDYIYNVYYEELFNVRDIEIKFKED